MSKCSRSSLTTTLALAAFGGIGVISAYTRLVRPWHLRWGATAAELRQPLLGDTLTPSPKLQATHALTIHASPEAIWPWLVQMGQGRGGFYSYEWIERLLGLHTRNANRIVPDLQELHAADEVPLALDGADGSEGVGLPVDILVANSALVMHADAPMQNSVAVAVMQPSYYSSVTWSFHLNPVDATNTRLIERWRADWEPTWSNTIMIHAVLEPGAFLMQRKMLLGIKARAECVWNSRDPITGFVHKGASMKALVLYDSQFGNTEQIAQAIAHALQTYGDVQITRVDQAQLSDGHGVDLLVLGCPTLKGRITPAMKAFLDHVPSQVVRGVAVACFDTRLDNMDWLTSSAAKGIARRLARMDVAVLVPPESFIVESCAGPLAEGELERAIKWAEVLHNRLDDTLEQPDAMVTA